MIILIFLFKRCVPIHGHVQVVIPYHMIINRIPNYKAYLSIGTCTNPGSYLDHLSGSLYSNVTDILYILRT